MQSNYEARIALGVAHQPGDVKILDAVEQCRRRFFPAISRFLEHDTVNLLDLIEVVPEPQNHQVSCKLPVDNERAQEDEDEDERDGDYTDEDIRHDQASPQTPEKPGTDNAQQPNEVVNSGNRGADPEDQPKQILQVPRPASEQIRDPKDGAQCQSPRGESRQAMRPVFAKKGIKHQVVFRRPEGYKA